MRQQIRNIDLINLNEDEKRELHIDGITARLQNKDGDVAYLDDVNKKIDKPTEEGDETHTKVIVLDNEGNSALKSITALTGEPLTEDFIVTKPAGNYNMGDMFPEGLTLAQAFKKLLTGVYEPTFVAPTFSLSNDKTSTQEVGATIDIKLTASFNPGAINGKNTNNVWAPTQKQNNRAGSATSYTINGVNQTSNVLTISRKIVKGNQTFNASVNYGAGPQPLNSDNENFSTPLAAGTLNSSTTVKGDYKRFYGPNDENVLNPRNGMSSVFDDTALTFSLNTGIDKRFFHIFIPSSRTLTGVIDETALNATITSQYILIGNVMVKDGGGVDTSYKHYRMKIDDTYPVSHVHKITIQ